MRKNSPPLEGWRFAIGELTGFFIVRVTTPSSSFGRSHPSGGGEFLSDTVVLDDEIF